MLEKLVGSSWLGPYQPFLKTGVTFAFFQIEGITPSRIDCLKIYVKIAEISPASPFYFFKIYVTCEGHILWSQCVLEGRVGEKVCENCGFCLL